VDVQRIYNEVHAAAQQFALVEVHPDGKGGVYVKAGFQTSVGNTYFTKILFEGYPYQMPQVHVTAPALSPSPHKYTDGHLCYFHPSVWNPGLHNLTFVLGRIAKWLNKYEVYRVYKKWPGAEILH